MNYEKLIIRYAQTRIDLVKAKDDLQYFNKCGDGEDLGDIREIRHERDHRTWTEIVNENKFKYGDFLELAKLLDRIREVKKQDQRNKQALLYHGKSLINKSKVSSSNDLDQIDIFNN